jgi:hypothetical protein
MSLTILMTFRSIIESTAINNAGPTVGCIPEVCRNKVTQVFKNWHVEHTKGCSCNLCCTVYYFRCVVLQFRSRVSSGSIVSDYGLYDRAIGVRSLAGAKDFSSILCVQTGSGAHPASCTMGIGGPSPGVKRGRGVTLTTHPHLVPISWMSRSYTSSPPKRFHGV